MQLRPDSIYHKLILILILFLGNCLTINAAIRVKNLLVEYAQTPIGIDVKNPRFSWQMDAASGERACSQTAYQIVVTTNEGKAMWNSNKVSDDHSLNIQYAGEPLQPATHYNWTVTVWDQNGKRYNESSWFETGLMNSNADLSAWDGAKWIGGDTNDLILYSPYLSVFKLYFTVQLDRTSSSTKAGFIFGANDSRLMDKNKNIFQMESPKNGSYIKFELDLSKVDGSENGLAQFNIYRVGYHPGDKADKPFKSYTLSGTLVNDENKYLPHEIYMESVFGSVNIYLDGKDPTHMVTTSENPASFSNPGLNINPTGRGGDYISFPVLADIGFSMDAGQKARFFNVRVTNFRNPSNQLFTEDLADSSIYNGIFANSGIQIRTNAYLIDGGKDGFLVTANPSKNSIPMLRTSFETAAKKITSARLSVTARGVYEFYINGQRIGNDYFNPGLTQYNKTHLYQTYDVTSVILKGKNAIGALLGEGWWSGNITYSGENWNFFGDRQSLLAKLVITYEDGSTQVITTKPGAWNYFNDGPIVYGSFFQGEVYDASKEAAVKDWSTPLYDDRNWKKCVEVPIEGTTCVVNDKDRMTGNGSGLDFSRMELVGQFGENAAIVKELTAIGVEEVRPGVFVYDMGQNMVGVPQITILNGKSGDKITLRYAEVKYPDLPEYGKNVGMIMLENIRAAMTQDLYTLKGGDEVIQPRFTFHGYRFIEITGIEKPFALAAVKGKVISSIHELTSDYVTSNQKVNKLWENINWSAIGNFLSIPSDCPQRNERMGWSGDISVFARTASYLSNASQFFRRHVLALRDVQRADGRFTDVAPLGGGFGGILWGSAGITVAWESYQQYGDIVMLEEHYSAMKKYMNFLATRIDTKTGVMNEGPLGDWLSPEGNKNDNTLIWEAYYVFDLETMSKMAEILGIEEDTKLFRQKQNERKAFFNKTYVNAESGKTVKSGFMAQRMGPPGANAPDNYQSQAGQLLNTQVSYAVPLALGTFDKEKNGLAAKNLFLMVEQKTTDDLGMVRPEYSLMTGFIGTAWISKALSDNGYNDASYRLLQQTTYPSWLYSVEQGATSIWERLNSYTLENGFGGNNSMNSFNHYSFGAVGAWMMNYSLGIERDWKEPGFKHFILQPTPDPTGQMTFARGYYDSMYGRIESEWKLENKKLNYRATVPANTTAMLYLPASSEKEITESGRVVAKAKGVKFVKQENGKTVFELQSGSYQFSIDQK